MEPILSHLVDKTPRNAPRDMLSRLYREIGISAVAAALEVSGDALEQRPATHDKPASAVKHAA